MKIEEESNPRRRVVIEGVSPEIDGGRFPIKRTVGETVTVEADIFADGHEVLGAVLKFRPNSSTAWSQQKMESLVNDRWRGSFTISVLEPYRYTVEAWVDHFGSWRRGLERKAKAGLDVEVELLACLPFFDEALKAAPKEDSLELRAALDALSPSSQLATSARVRVALSPRIAQLIDRHSEHRDVTRYVPELRVLVDPLLGRYGAWFEMFPRSASPSPGRHGTLKDCEAWLPKIAEMGFDVLYLPPVHPIGRSFRKGKNNRLTATPDDPGSPWAIGAEEGGHKSVHPHLGTIEDFRHLVEQARELRVEVALDIALQCSPDHPYVQQHPEWFRKRPDGSIQYAENPPKKYQDIYPFDFESPDWEALWQELKSIFTFWIEQGVRVFRVDNPHTKPFRFWEWCLGELKAAHPELLFLAEAFTRPKLMYYLAKAGFTQSYNYFPWRNTKQELETYLTEVTQGAVREFFRPNLWPNTPDILTQYLQNGGRPACMSRFVLAATLGASYGIYGPPFLAAEAHPREPGSEEYLDSEKYEIRHWDPHGTEDLVGLISQVNQIRKDHPALQTNESLRFHPTDNDYLVAFTKTTPDLDDVILVIVNVDPYHTQRGWITLPIEEWGIKRHESYQGRELLTEAFFLWTGAKNYVELDPKFIPAHILHLRRYVRTEHDFDYFM